MNATELIKYIYENNLTEDILNKLDCYNITDREKEFRCGLPEDTSNTRVRIKKTEYLNITIFQSDDKIIRGNIITLVMHIKNVSFPRANKLIHEYIGIKYSYKKTSNKNTSKKANPLDFFKSMYKKKRNFDVSSIDLYDENLLIEYTPNLHKSWLSEGIISKTARIFNIGYDYKTKRIIIPHRLWSGNENDYVGIIGRTTIKNFELLGIPKYFPLKAYPKGINLYGLNENYKEIQEKGYVVVFEAEKSVLKRHSRLDGTGVALMCHDITDEQVKILIGLNVEIIFAMDKGVKKEHVWSMCDKFYGIRKVGYIEDKYNIIPDKESPADLSNKIYESLFKYRTLYDSKIKRRYNAWQKENQKKN